MGTWGGKESYFHKTDLQIRLESTSPFSLYWRLKTILGNISRREKHVPECLLHPSHSHQSFEGFFKHHLLWEAFPRSLPYEVTLLSIPTAECLPCIIDMPEALPPQTLSSLRSRALFSFLHSTHSTMSCSEEVFSHVCRINFTFRLLSEEKVHFSGVFPPFSNVCVVFGQITK